jgi:D-alanyl-D-alanine carboxypeptidase
MHANRLTCRGLLAFVAAQALGGSPIDEGIDSVDAFANYLTSRDEFSGVIVIEQHHQRLYAQAFGLADHDAKIPVTLTTPFSVASQGRMFAAIAVLQLVEAGKVGLDDPVGNYVPDYPNRDIADNVTIRFLLTHWGGPDSRVLEPDAIDTREAARSRPNLVATSPGLRHAACAPGPIEDCSTYGLTLLGDVIQRVSGQSYGDYVEQHILRVAGMTQTRPTSEQMKGVAIGYSYIGELKHPSAVILPARGLPMSGGVSTADDEIRFMNALSQGQLISKQSLSQATDGQTPWFGYAWDYPSAQPKGLPHWGQAGGVEGSSLMLVYYPTVDLTAVCLSNRDPPACDDVLARLNSSLTSP